MTGVGVTRLSPIPACTALERLSFGEPIENAHIVGTLDLDPLAVSRWLCGEDLFGIYQPISLHRCLLDGLDMAGRTFYELVELVGCTVREARLVLTYFYSDLLVEDSRFEGRLDAQGMQADGRVIVYNTLFAGHADFRGAQLRHRASFAACCFAGGTNLLHDVYNGRPEACFSLDGCRFRAQDVPEGFDVAAHRLKLLPG